MKTARQAGLIRAGTLALLTLLSLALAPYATASPGGGDTTVGTLPVSGTAYTRTRSTPPIVVERLIAGDDGTTITAARDGILLVARTSTGQENATQGTPLEPMSASWVSGGTTFTVTIYVQPGESDDDAADRLDRRVRAMQRRRPRDGAATGQPQGVWLHPPIERELEAPFLTRAELRLAA